MFYFFMVMPGMQQPVVYEEKVATIEECIGMVARYSYKTLDNPRQSKVQMSCQLEIPETISH
jgi:hypothetical protein